MISPDSDGDDDAYDVCSGTERLPWSMCPINRFHRGLIVGQTRVCYCYVGAAGAQIPWARGVPEQDA